MPLAPPPHFPVCMDVCAQGGGVCVGGAGGSGDVLRVSFPGFWTELLDGANGQRDMLSSEPGSSKHHTLSPCSSTPVSRSLCHTERKSCEQTSVGGHALEFSARSSGGARPVRDLQRALSMPALPEPP